MRPIIMMAISAHRSVALLVAATAAGILDDDSRAFRAHLDERRMFDNTCKNVEWTFKAFQDGRSITFISSQQTDARMLGCFLSHQTREKISQSVRQHRLVWCSPSASKGPVSSIHTYPLSICFPRGPH